MWDREGKGARTGCGTEQVSCSGGSGDSTEQASESPRPPSVPPPPLPSGCPELRLQPEALVPGAPGQPERKSPETPRTACTARGNVWEKWLL